MPGETPPGGRKGGRETMYDLRIVVDEVKGFCDMPMKVGDFFEVRGGRIIVPPGQHICMWALQSLMPFFPVKQRASKEENDWIPYTKRISCPDPNGMVIYRIDRIGDPEDEKREVFRRMLVDPARCTGCRSCEAACPSDAIHIEAGADGGFSPKVCRQCGNARCASACPTGALSKDPDTKAVLVDEEKCVGCGACKAACPFGSITIPEGKARICTLCGGEPKCAAACPTDAVFFGRMGDSPEAGAK